MLLSKSIDLCIRYYLPLIAGPIPSLIDWIDSPKIMQETPMKE